MSEPYQLGNNLSPNMNEDKGLIIWDNRATLRNHKRDNIKRRLGPRFFIEHGEGQIRKLCGTENDRVFRPEDEGEHHIEDNIITVLGEESDKLY